jgi:hypothetical protein
MHALCKYLTTVCVLSLQDKFLSEFQILIWMKTNLSAFSFLKIFNQFQVTKTFSRNIVLGFLVKHIIHLDNFYMWQEVYIKVSFITRCQWLMPIILAIQEAEIRRIMVWNQPEQIDCEIISWKYSTQKRTGKLLKW